ncbi:MAG: sigma-70 family RNA polymerase sigma factor [Planctomycetota bacterium]|jgi:RNA polymerase sigma-70 factor (ECF subfamily)
MTGPELDLWRRWKERRDARAFEALVERHGAFAYDFARRATGHDADAEDLAQDAFLRLAEADNADKVGFRAFLGRHISLGAKMLRRASLTRARLDKHAHVPTHPENAIENREAAEAALALLDEEERAAVVLRFLHGLSYEEIAHVLGCKEGAARVRVHRALKQLRTRLGHKPELAIAALPLFAPRSPLVAPTAKAAVALTGGALLMNAKKIAGLVAVLLFAAGGVAVWRTSREAPAHTERAAAPVREIVVKQPEPEPEAERVEKPEAPHTIPKGKGSVAGVIRFADGKPFANKKLSLWGTPAVMGETDGEGRFHIHGDWVYERTLCVRRDDESYFLGLATAHMKAGEVIELDLTLQRGFTLAGQVTHEGEPVAGAEVHLRRRDDGEEQGGFGFVDADGHGRFRFDHLPAGIYHLFAKRPGLETVITKLELERDATLPIAMKPAREVVVKFNNLPPAWIGASINLMIQQSVNPQFSFDFTPKIDERGEVRVDAPPPGVYRVELIPGRNAPLPRLNANNVSIRAGEPPRLEFNLPDGAGVAGSIVRADGTPYDKAQLAFETGDYETRARKDGSFSFGFVATGSNRLVLRGRRWQILLAEIDIPKSGSLRHDVQLRGTARVFGKLVSGGSPWSRVVELYREDEYARVWPEGNGAFAIPHLEAGRYRLVASAENTEPYEREIELADGEQLDLGELRPRGFPKVPVTFKLPAGREMPSVLTALALRDGKYHTAYFKLDEAGHGHLSKLAPGVYEMHLAPNGCKRRTVTVEVGADAAPLVFEFEKAPIRLTVPIELIAPSGFELPDVIQVIARSIDGTQAGTGFIVLSARTLSNLPAGKYDLEFRVEGLEPKLAQVEIREGMDPIKVELVRASR